MERCSACQCREKFASSLGRFSFCKMELYFVERKSLFSTRMLARSLYILSFVLLPFLAGFGQNDQSFEVDYSVRKMEPVAPVGQVNFSALPPLEEQFLTTVTTIKPAPGTGEETSEETSEELEEAKAYWQQQRADYEARNPPGSAPTAHKTASNVSVTVAREFDGNAYGGSLPNDNDIAISDSGWIVSVINTSVDIYDTTGQLRGQSSLAALGAPLGNFSESFDHRVVYDPNANRFIIIWLNASTSNTNSIVLAFSQTADPRDDWNIYQISGNPLNDGTWSDYPTVGMSQDDLYISVNAFLDQGGFQQSNVWQVQVAEGYAGQPIQSQVFSDFSVNGNTVFNICPVDGATGPYGPNMYLLSNLHTAQSNNFLYIAEVPDNLASGNTNLSSEFIFMDENYGAPPNAPQPLNNKQLNTNDARIQHAILKDGSIHYVHNTVSPSFFTSAIYYGRVEDVATNPMGFGQFVESSTLWYGYPDIAYVGDGSATDNRMLIAFCHTSDQLLPGASAVAIDNNHQLSPAVIWKDGVGGLNVMSEPLERWGDYSGLERWPGQLNSAWAAVGYGGFSNRNFTHIAELSTAPLVSREEDAVTPETSTAVFPNPMRELETTTLRFEAEQTAVYRIRLLGMNGQEIQVLYNDRVKAGLNELRFNTQPLPAGTYLLEISTQNGTRETKRVVVE